MHWNFVFIIFCVFEEDSWRVFCIWFCLWFALSPSRPANYIFTWAVSNSFNLDFGSTAIHFETFCTIPISLQHIYKLTMAHAPLNNYFIGLISIWYVHWLLRFIIVQIWSRELQILIFFQFLKLTFHLLNFFAKLFFLIKVFQLWRWTLTWHLIFSFT